VRVPLKREEDPESFVKAERPVPSPDALREVFPTNPLREVAFEVRFPVSLRILRDVFLLQEYLGSEYPHFEREVVQLSGNSTSLNYVFYNQSRGRIVKSGEDRFAVVFTRYKDFGEFRAEVTERVRHFCEMFNVNSLTRMGLRYINNIHVHGNGQPPDFSAYIRPYADFQSNKIEEFGIDVLMQKADCFLNARSAFAPQPPAASAICTLDFDAFIQGRPTLGQLDDFLERSHHHIQVEFLNHITDEYKQEMRKQR
jgi:uncharacterized protein (TIGR04255 family)